MRIAGVWFHRNDFLFSSDAEIITTLRTTVFNSVGHIDADIYNNPEAVYCVTYGESCDAVKIACVPIALERDNFAVFACVGSTDGFSTATLASIARRMGNAIRIIIRREDLQMGNFRANRAEIKAVLAFTRRSLSEPDLVHGAFSEAFVDSVFDTTKPKFISQMQQQQDGGLEPQNSLQYWSANPTESSPIFEVHWIRGAVLCGNNIINSFEDATVARSCQTTALGWDGFLYLARVMLSFQCDRRLMENSTYLESGILDGEDRFRHLRLFRDDVLHTVEGATGEDEDADDDEDDENNDDDEIDDVQRRGASGNAGVSSSSGNSRAASQQQQGGGGGRALGAASASASPTSAAVPLERRGGVAKVSTHPVSHLCDVTAVTGALLRGLDGVATAALSDIKKREEKEVENKTADAATETEAEENGSSTMHPELIAMMRAFGARFHDAPGKYDSYANAVHNSSAVDSLRTWGEMETGSFQQQRRHEREQLRVSKQSVADKRAPLHYQVKSSDQRVQFWVSFKYVDFDRKSNSNNNNNNNNNVDGMNENQPHHQDVATSSNGYVIALFSYSLQFADPDVERPLNCKTTSNGFYPLLDEIVARMVATAETETALDSNIWSKIRSSRAAEIFFENKSPHLLAIDVVDRSHLLDVPNARILFDEFDPDIVCSRLAPRLVRRSPVLESLDVDESRGETCRARKHSLLKWLDTFRRSISRAHHMFAAGSVEGAWSSSEGAFFHGLFVTRRVQGNTTSPYAVVAAPAKYLQKLPYGTLIPTAASTPFSTSSSASSLPSAGSGGGGGGASGAGGGGGDGRSRAGDGSLTGAGSGGGTSSNSSAGIWTVEDVPIARIYTENPPPIPTLPAAPLEHLPLGLLEVHCMFTPNTDVDVMGVEMFYALGMMHAF